jgi:hypothetical protein
MSDKRLNDFLNHLRARDFEREARRDFDELCFRVALFPLGFRDELLARACTTFEGESI